MKIDALRKRACLVPQTYEVFEVFERNIGRHTGVRNRGRCLATPGLPALPGLKEEDETRGHHDHSTDKAEYRNVVLAVPLGRWQ